MPLCHILLLKEWIYFDVNERMLCIPTLIRPSIRQIGQDSFRPDLAQSSYHSITIRLTAFTPHLNKSGVRYEDLLTPQITLIDRAPLPHSNVHLKIHNSARLSDGN